MRMVGTVHDGVGDPFMMIIPPIEQFTNNYLVEAFPLLYPTISWCMFLLSFFKLHNRQLLAGGMLSVQVERFVAT